MENLMDRGSAEDPELSAFLDKVDAVSSLVQGLHDGDAAAASKADAFISKHSPKVDANGVEEIDGTRVTSSRTMINKGGPAPVPPSGPPQPQEPEGEQAAFMAGLAADAEMRNERRRKGRIAAVEFKEKGNAAFRQGRFSEAEDQYSEALRLHPDNLALYTNRAQARLRLAKYEEAIDDCGWALRLDERNVKAHLRMGLAQQGLGRFAEALESLETARKASPAKNRPEIVAHMEETTRLQKVADDEARVLAAAQAGDDMASLVGRMQAAQDAEVCARVATQLADLVGEDAGNPDLFRVKGGMEALSTCGALKPLFDGPDSGIASITESDSSALCLVAVLRMLMEGCRGCEASRRHLTNRQDCVGAMARIVRHCTISECRLNALSLVATLADSAHGREVLSKNSTLCDECLCILVSKDRPMLERMQAGVVLSFFAVVPTYRKAQRPTFLDSIWPRLLSVLEEQVNPAMQGTLNLVLHLAGDEELRAMLAEEEQFGKLSLLLPSLLAGLLGQGAADSSECLISLLGVLTNVGLVEGVAAKMATSPLVAALSELLSIAQTLPLRRRTLGLLSRLCVSEEAVGLVSSTKALKKMKTLVKKSADKETLESVTRAMAKCAQNGAREEIGSTGCIEALVRLLSYDDSEVVAGNSALCLAECCRDTSVCRFLVGTNVVTDLLHHAKKEVSGVQENCSVALARLARGDSAHLQTLRDNNGLEILYTRAKQGGTA